MTLFVSAIGPTEKTAAGHEVSPSRKNPKNPVGFLGTQRNPKKPYKNKIKSKNKNKIKSKNKNKIKSKNKVKVKNKNKIHLPPVVPRRGNRLRRVWPVNVKGSSPQRWTRYAPIV